MPRGRLLGGSVLPSPCPEWSFWRFPHPQTLYLEKKGPGIGLSLLIAGIHIHKMCDYTNSTSYFFLSFKRWTKWRKPKPPISLLEPSPCFWMQGRLKSRRDNSVDPCGLCGLRGPPDWGKKCLFQKMRHTGQGCRLVNPPLQNCPTGNTDALRSRGSQAAVGVPGAVVYQL